MASPLLNNKNILINSGPGQNGTYEDKNLYFKYRAVSRQRGKHTLAHHNHVVGFTAANGKSVPPDLSALKADFVIPFNWKNDEIIYLMPYFSMI